MILHWKNIIDKGKRKGGEKFAISSPYLEGNSKPRNAV